jgi:hypothetical protein
MVFGLELVLSQRMGGGWFKKELYKKISSRV